MNRKETSITLDEGTAPAFIADAMRRLEEDLRQYHLNEYPNPRVHKVICVVEHDTTPEDYSTFNPRIQNAQDDVYEGD